MKHLFLLLALFLFTKAFTQVSWMPVSYNISVKIKNKDISVSEKFSAFKTELIFSPDTLSSSHFKTLLHVATSIKGTEGDSTLRADHIDSGKYTLVAVESVTLYPKGNRYAGRFKITVNGKTKETEIPFDFVQYRNEAEFRSTFNINTKNFDNGLTLLTKNETANVSILIKAKG